MGSQCAFAYTADDNGYAEINDSLSLSQIGYYSESEGRYVIPSTIQHSGVTYALLKHGITLEDIESGAKNMADSALTIGQTSVNDSGEYNIRVRVKGTTGTYSLLVYNMYTGYTVHEIEYTDYAYKSINEIRENGSVSDMKNWIDENLDSSGIDSDGYKLLNDADKELIAKGVMEHPEFESNDEVTNYFSGIDICSMIFKNGNFENADAYINVIVNRDNSFLDKRITEKYLAMDSGDRAEILAPYLGGEFGKNSADRFYMSILKQIVSKYKLVGQMESVINDRDNIWGFASDDIKSLSKSNVTAVYGEMEEYAKNCAKLSDYVAYLSTAIKNNPKSGGGSGSGSGSGSGGSSRSSSGSGTVSIPVPIQNNSSDIAKQSFTDLDGASWVKNIVEKLAADKIINGRADGIFAPNEGVTREEFVKMLMAAMRLTGIEAENKYSDISESDWFCAPVAAATRAKIVSGISNGVFGVGRNITRQDAAVILKRALDFRGVVLVPNSTEQFADVKSVSDYASESVEKLSSAGIINGYGDNTFRPHGSITRAEAAKLIYEFMVASGEYSGGEQR